MKTKRTILFFFFILPELVFAAQDYLDNIPIFWRSIYPDGGTTLYCGHPFKAFDKKVNIEHILPMNWVKNSLGCKSRKHCRRVSARFRLIESDMHNLYPAMQRINQLRGAMAFGLVKGDRNIEKGCDFEIDYRKRKVEPRPAIRGDIARAMLYMSDEYQVPLYSRQKQLLLRWHSLDPPDDEERRRNKLIEKLQGKRNRYIDSPNMLN